MVTYGSLRGHYSLQTASEVKSNLRCEISDLKYLQIYVQIVYLVPYGDLRGHYSLQTAAEVKSDLRFEICDLNYLHIHVHIVYIHKIH